MSPFDGIRHEYGWTGAFTRAQADGAIKNGTPVVKTNSEKGDGNPDGTPGVVLGSMFVGNIPPPPHLAHNPPQFVYFVEWASRPRHAVAATDFKLREAAR